MAVPGSNECLTTADGTLNEIRAPMLGGRSPSLAASNRPFPPLRLYAHFVCCVYFVFYIFCCFVFLQPNAYRTVGVVCSPNRRGGGRFHGVLTMESKNDDNSNNKFCCCRCCRHSWNSDFSCFVSHRAHTFPRVRILSLTKKDKRKTRL
jgi:hypothetical protein